MENKKIAIFTGRSLLNGNLSAKHYPYWQHLIGILQWEGIEVHQFGIESDMDFFCDKRFCLSLKETEEKIKEYDLFISVDTWIHHMIDVKNIDIKGIVLFGQSDPRIFGSNKFINLYKDEYLRKNQHYVWVNQKYIKEAFPSAIEVAKIAIDILKGE